MQPKTESEIEAMRTGGRMLATVLQLIKKQVSAGMTPREVSALAAAELQRLGGTASFKGFEGYPDIICISTNNEVRDGARVGDISSAVRAVLRAHDLGIVRELVGHGVGHELHEDPEIPNYGHAGTGPTLKAGMTIAIEPITTLGSPRIFQAHDGWTLLTADGSRSAQFEHTVLVTKDGAEILTTV
jgi:methionine aminopeptidase